MRLIPFLLGEQIDGEVGPKPVADIGEEEVGGVQRAARLQLRRDMLRLDELRHSGPRTLLS